MITVYRGFYENDPTGTKDNRDRFVFSGYNDRSSLLQEHFLRERDLRDRLSGNCAIYRHDKTEFESGGLPFQLWGCDGKLMDQSHPFKSLIVPDKPVRKRTNQGVEFQEQGGGVMRFEGQQFKCYCDK